MTGAPAREPVFAVLSGGGTGGHVYPAVALAEVLAARGHPRAGLRFVGARRGLEARVVREAGFDIELLPGRGLQRRVTLENLTAAREAAVAFRRAWRLLGAWRPRVVVGFGGYASLPAVVAARSRRVPTVVHDQDAAPGLANRIAVRLGARAATSLPAAALPGAVLVGNPVRPELLTVRRDPQHPPLVALWGGSLGAGTVNDAALDLYDRWRTQHDVALRLVSGPRNLDGCAARLAALRRRGDALAFSLDGYEPAMAALLGRTAVAVCRAGAGTVAELAATGTPAVLIPLPGAPHDHQTRNAEAFAAVGAGVVLADGACTGERLAGVLDELLGDVARRERMSEAARGLARPDAAERLADLVEEAAGG